MPHSLLLSWVLCCITSPGDNTRARKLDVWGILSNGHAGYPVKDNTVRYCCFCGSRKIGHSYMARATSSRPPSPCRSTAAAPLHMAMANHPLLHGHGLQTCLQRENLHRHKISHLQQKTGRPKSNTGWSATTSASADWHGTQIHAKWIRTSGWISGWERLFCDLPFTIHKLFGHSYLKGSFSTLLPCLPWNPSLLIFENMLIDRRISNGSTLVEDLQYLQ